MNNLLELTIFFIRSKVIKVAAPIRVAYTVNLKIPLYQIVAIQQWLGGGGSSQFGGMDFEGTKGYSFQTMKRGGG